MKLLKDILYKTGLLEISGSTHIAINDVQTDSRAVKNHSLFVAIKGTQTDGHNFISKAIDNGAIAIVCEEFPNELNENITYIKVKNTSIALGYIASNFYDNPSSQLILVGVTGTNGKTTTATLLYNLFKVLGFKCGLISTVKYKIDNQEINATHTTPDALQFNKLLRQMVDSGCKYCFTEVSSHSVVQHRITGLDFKGAIFTNITHDHLDYHGTFDNYIKAKKVFFDMLSSEAFALINKDDKNGWIMLQNTKAIKKTYSLLSDADFKAKVIETHLTGLVLNIDGHELWTKLIGKFNAYNLLAVYACAILLKQDKIKVLTAISNLNSVEGRFQYIKSKNNITAVIDYAHTPDALLNVLKTIKEIVADKGKIITVVGCGGDRDAQKRPEMARIACEWSNKVILTSDNPRSEDPEEIIKQMKKGVDITSAKKTLTITDRREAIKTACALASSGDIVLVAGKGHEKYQEIKGVKYPFDDVQEVTDAFKILELI